MSARLHVLREANLQDVPATLREIADSIEAGEYGTAKGCAVVLDADRVHVFYTGTGEAGPNAHLLFSVGAAKMVQVVIDSQRD